MPITRKGEASGSSGAGSVRGCQAGGGVGQLHILNYPGGQLHAVDLPASFPAGSWNGGLAAPTIANIDADADLEVVVGTAHSGVVAYDLPNTANARLLWSTGRGSAKRSGVAKPDREYRSGFADVPPWHTFYPFINTVALNSVTSGCYASPPLYCPTQGVTRAQMAVFLLRSQYGPAYVPPACTTPVFSDVPCNHPFAAWINDLVARGVTAGCGQGTLFGRRVPSAAAFFIRSSKGSIPSFSASMSTVDSLANAACTAPGPRYAPAGVLFVSTS